MINKYLRREPAGEFKTRQVLLSASGDIRSVGEPLSFPEMSALRNRGQIQVLDSGDSRNNAGHGQLFANLGVSLQLIIHHGDRKALALVEQKHETEGSVLKLVSGYVPESQLHNPLKAAWAELMEEVLPQTVEGCLGFCHHNTPLDDPYQLAREGYLEIRETSFLGEARPGQLRCDGVVPDWPCSYYIHQPTASLQLVFPVAVTLPDNISLIHVEDRLDKDTSEVVSFYDPHYRVILMELNGAGQSTGELFTLEQGIWKPFYTTGSRLSEYFDAAGKGIASGLA